MPSEVYHSRKKIAVAVLRVPSSVGGAVVKYASFRIDPDLRFRGVFASGHAFSDVFDVEPFDMKFGVIPWSSRMTRRLKGWGRKARFGR